MNKLMEAIIAINTKGTLQEQAEKLADEMYCYKNLIFEYNDRIQEILDDELLEELYLMRSKYKVRLENVKKECCILNKRIKDTLDAIEEYVDFELFVETFKLNDDEVDGDSSFYENLIVSSEKIGHVVRTGLIYNETYLRELMKEDV